MASSKQEGPYTIGQLFVLSFETLKKNMRAFVIITLVMGTIGTASGYITVKQYYADSGQYYGISGDKFQALIKRVSAGDAAAKQEYKVLTTEAKKHPDQTARALRSVFIDMFLIWFPANILLFISLLMMWIIAVEQNGNLTHALTVALKKFFPYIGQKIWTLLRSFIWLLPVGVILGFTVWSLIIPAFLFCIAGIVLSIILSPRFFLSTVILLGEDQGLFRNVSASYRQSRGYWGKIVGNNLVVALCYFAAYIAVYFALKPVSMNLPQLGLWLLNVISTVFVAFLAIFQVRLSQTILKHPKAFHS